MADKFYIAEGKHITSLRGVLIGGDQVFANYFQGGEDTFKTLIKKGVIVKVKSKEVKKPASENKVVKNPSVENKVEVPEEETKPEVSLPDLILDNNVKTDGDK